MQPLATHHEDSRSVSNTLPEPLTLPALLALDDTALTLIIEAVCYHRHWTRYSYADAVWPLYVCTTSPTPLAVRAHELPQYGATWERTMALVRQSGCDLTLDQAPDDTVVVRVEGRVCACLEAPTDTALRRAICAGVVWAMQQRAQEGQAFSS